MEVYLLKASAILAIFFATYHGLLKKETFFRLNRYFLLSGLVAAILLPLLSIKKEVVVFMTRQSNTTAAPLLNASEASGYSGWEYLLWSGYVFGAAFFLIRIIKQLWTLIGLMRSGNTVKSDGYLLVPQSIVTTPFSFFKYIFYNPQSHSPGELSQILEHEKAHCRQIHSLDILLGRAVAVLLWMNPLAWWYQRSIQQNLEYLADADAVQQLPSVKEYQYTLLKVSGNTLTPKLVNAFYSSLIKKRIVMLHQNQSRKIHLLKYLLILPALAFFLMAFNRETVYVMKDSPSELFSTTEEKTIELLIDKNTTDGQLLKMKENLTKDKIDFSYTVVRNEGGEIINLSFSINGKADNGNPFSGNYNSDSDTPIQPVMIHINSTGGIFFGEASAYKEMSKVKELHFSSDSGNKVVWVQRMGDENEDTETIKIRKVNGKEIIFTGTSPEEAVYLRKLEEGDSDILEMVKENDSLHRKKMIWVHSTENEDTETIEIRKIKGKDMIIIDGEASDLKELSEEGHTKKIFVKRIETDEDLREDAKLHRIEIKEDGDHEQIIMVGPDKGGDYNVSKKMRIHLDEETGKNYKTVIINTEKSGDFNGKASWNIKDSNALFIIDGKKASRKKMEKLSPDEIESINVWKGEKAIEKYGQKAENGVVEITTKKQ